jgi:hypothetical protein
MTPAPISGASMHSEDRDKSVFSSDLALECRPSAGYTTACVSGSSAGSDAEQDFVR